MAEAIGSMRRCRVKEIMNTAIQPVTELRLHGLQPTDQVIELAADTPRDQPLHLLLTFATPFSGWVNPYQPCGAPEVPTHVFHFAQSMITIPPEALQHYSWPLRLIVRQASQESENSAVARD